MSVRPPAAGWSGYFVGIGAQKAGTTWLASTLFEHDDVWANPVKEMHVFDRAHGIRPPVAERERRRLARVRKRRGRVRETIDGPDDPKREFKDALVAMLDYAEVVFEDLAAVVEAPTRAERDERYRAYFADRVGAERVFGEITPSYALLPVAGFEEILDCYPDARVLYVLRDPVDRLWAGVRQHHKERPYGEGQIDHDALLEDEATLARTRYEVTLAALDAVVPADQQLVVFYEELFDPEDDRARRDVGTFLGVEVGGDVGERRNVGVDVDLTRRREEVAFAHLAPTYDAIEARLGRLPPRWRERRDALGRRRSRRGRAAD